MRKLRTPSASYFYRPLSGSNIFVPKQYPSIDELGRLLAKIAGAVGIIVASTYFVKEHFFPSGLSAGDSIFFLFVSLVFGLVYGYLVGAAVFVSEPLAKWLMNSRDKRKYKNLKIHLSEAKRLKGRHFFLMNVFNIGLLGVLRLIVTFLLAVFYLLLVRSNDWFTSAFFVFLMVAVGCTIYILFYFQLPQFRTSSRLRSVLIGGVTIFPLIFVPNLLGGMVDTTMSAIGVRIDNASISLPIEEYAFIQAVSKRLGNELDACEMLEGKRCLMAADILFQGIGNKTLIRIPVDKSIENVRNKSKGIRFIVDATSMKIAMSSAR